MQEPAPLCGFVSVPLRHGDAGSPRIRLAVVVIPALDKAGRQPDPLFLAQGGPGGSTISGFGQVLLDDPAKRPTFNRDLVLWDQRGTYFSQPRLSCREVGQLAAGADEEKQKDAYRRCGERLAKEAGDLSAYNSLENARDVDAVRAALGYGKFNFYGVSYGTELGQFLMRERPPHLRSVVFDAVVPLGFSLVTDVPAIRQQVMQQYARACEQSPTCNAAYPSLGTRYLALLDRLDKEPVPYALVEAKPASGAPRVTRAALTGKDLDSVLYQSIYMREAVPLIPYVVSRAEEGDFSFVLNIAMLLGASQDDMADGMYMTVVCSEYGDTPETALRFPGVLKRLADAAQSDAQQVLTLCRDWRIRLLDKKLLEPVKSDIPTLLLSGRFDPITPPAQADRVAAGLTHAFRVTFAGGTHGQAFTVPCANRIIAAFLDAPTSAPDGACAQETPPNFVTPDQLLSLPGRKARRQRDAAGSHVRAAGPRAGARLRAGAPLQRRARLCGDGDRARVPQPRFSPAQRLAGPPDRRRALGARVDRPHVAGLSRCRRHQRGNGGVAQSVAASDRRGAGVGKGPDLGPAALRALAHPDDACDGALVAARGAQPDGASLLHAAGLHRVVRLRRVVAHGVVRLVAFHNFNKGERQWLKHRLLGAMQRFPTTR